MYAGGKTTPESLVEFDYDGHDLPPRPHIDRHDPAFRADSEAQER